MNVCMMGWDSLMRDHIIFQLWTALQMAWFNVIHKKDPHIKADRKFIIIRKKHILETTWKWAYKFDHATKDITLKLKTRPTLWRLKAVLSINHFKWNSLVATSFFLLSTRSFILTVSLYNLKPGNVTVFVCSKTKERFKTMCWTCQWETTTVPSCGVRVSLHACRAWLTSHKSVQ